MIGFPGTTVVHIPGVDFHSDARHWLAQSMCYRRFEEPPEDSDKPVCKNCRRRAEEQVAYFAWLLERWETRAGADPTLPSADDVFGILAGQ